MKKLYQYAIVFNPKDKKEETKIIKEPSHILAVDEKSLVLELAMGLPEEYRDRLSEVEIMIRPF